jgi:hypothetical protein
MTFTLKLLAGVAVLVGATACASAPAAPAAPGKSGASAHPAAPAVALDEVAMMAEMMKLSMPGPEHAELQKTVGTWEKTQRMRWSPDAEWMTTTCTSQVTPLLGGRYVMEQLGFEMMGMPMEGLSITGFDNMTGEYTSLWADSMSTWWTSSRGKAAADGSIDFRGTMTDVAGSRPFRMVLRQGPDSGHMDMYDTIPPHGEVLVMTIDSKRVGGAR